jgi:hypothetical protein
MKNKHQLSGFEVFGLISSIVGLMADFIALGAFGYSLMSSGNQVSETPVTVVLWIGFLTIFPLTYFWGFISWITSLRYGKASLSVLGIGLILLPLYLLWGISILPDVYEYLDQNNYGMQNTMNTALFNSFGIWIIIGLSIWLITFLWQLLTGKFKLGK